MSTWRSGVAEFFRQRRVARYERRQARDSQRDQNAAEELKRAASDRFPHMGVAASSARTLRGSACWLSPDPPIVAVASASSRARWRRIGGSGLSGQAPTSTLHREPPGCLTTTWTWSATGTPWGSVTTEVAGRTSAVQPRPAGYSRNRSSTEVPSFATEALSATGGHEPLPHTVIWRRGPSSSHEAATGMVRSSCLVGTAPSGAPRCHSTAASTDAERPCGAVDAVSVDGDSAIPVQPTNSAQPIVVAAARMDRIEPPTTMDAARSAWFQRATSTSVQPRPAGRQHERAWIRGSPSARTSTSGVSA